MLVRRPCLSDAGFREKLKTLARERADPDAWGTILFEELGFLPRGVAADLCHCAECARAYAGRNLPGACTLEEARRAGNLEGWCAHRLFMSSLPGQVEMGEFIEPGAMGVELCGAYSILPDSLRGLSWCSFRDGLSAWAASGAAGCCRACCFRFRRASATVPLEISKESASETVAAAGRMHSPAASSRESRWRER